MKEIIARYILVIATLLVVVIDTAIYFLSGSNQNAVIDLILVESALDILSIFVIYYVLSSEIRQQRHLSEELAKVNIKVEEANKLKTRLLGMAAHDLRNPLGVIKGFSELLLLKDSNLDSDSLDYIQKIERKSDEMLALVSDLLSSSVLDQGGLRVEPKPVVLNDLLNQSVMDIVGQTEKKKQVIVIHQGQRIAAMVDEKRMRQVISNLLSNAIKYSPLGSTIEIGLVRKDRSAEISVKDHGPGLTPQEKAKIFQPFSEIKHSTTGGELSTGLGLSIAKALVDLHGGTLYVESEGPGLGSTFKVEIPAI